MTNRTARMETRGWAALLAVAIVAFPSIASGQGGNAGEGAASGSLAPLFVLSIAIERFWETAFTLIESSAAMMGAIIGSLSRSMSKVQRRLAEAQRAFDAAKKAVTGNGGNDVEKAALDADFARAHEALDAAKADVMGMVADPVYVSLKRTVILCGSLVIGPLVAFGGHITLFATMGFAHTPERLDMAVSGIIIGSGSEPIHNLVSSLGGLRTALASVAGAAQRPPMVDTVTTTIGTAPNPDGPSGDAPSVQVTATAQSERR